MKKCLSILCFLLAPLWPVWLWTQEPSGSSSIQAANVQFMQLIVKGNMVIVALSEHPDITYTGNTMHIATKDNDIDVAVADISFFGFSETDQPVQGIKLPQIAKPKFVSGQVLFTQLKPDSAVEVFAADGRKVAALSANDDGVAIVDLSSKPKGTYIIKTATQTMKVTNKK